MSARLRLRRVTYAPPLLNSSAGCVGPFDSPYPMNNFLTAVKKFQFVFELDTYGGSPEWDFTDPDGAGLGTPNFPGENPANLHAFLQSRSLPDTEYYVRRENPRVWNLGINDGSAQGTISTDFLAFQFTDDLKFYSSPPSFQVFAPDVSWLVGLGGSDIGAVTFNWLGKSVDLRSDNCSGKVTLIDTDWWS